MEVEMALYPKERPQTRAEIQNTWLDSSYELRGGQTKTRGSDGDSRSFFTEKKSPALEGGDSTPCREHRHASQDKTCYTSHVSPHICDTFARKRSEPGSYQSVVGARLDTNNCAVCADGARWSEQKL